MIPWSIDLPDTVVVSGSASGLGQECARALAVAGVRVVGIDVNPAAPELAGLDGYEHVSGSVAEPDAWQRAVAAVGPARPGESLGLLGAAAVLDVGVLESEDIGNWRRTWEINVLGNVLGVRTLLPRLRAADTASVVVVTSVDAEFGEQDLAAYASSKAALSSAVRSIALDYARSGVVFNLLAPGPMRAGLFERHRAASDDPAAFLEDMQARHPVGRVLGVDEVARSALFLLSSAASALYATTVTADGGLTACFDFEAPAA